MHTFKSMQLYMYHKIASIVNIHKVNNIKLLQLKILKYIATLVSVKLNHASTIVNLKRFHVL